MIFNPTPIDGAYIIDVEKIEDDRGFFGRAFCADVFRDKGIPFAVAQANVGFSRKKGTLRGLHYQVPPHEEAKLVRCIRGAVFDVIIDLRKGSRSYGRWFGTELTAAHPPALPYAQGHGPRISLPGGRFGDPLSGFRILHSRRRTRDPMGRSGLRHPVAYDRQSDGLGKGSHVA